MIISSAIIIRLICTAILVVLFYGNAAQASYKNNCVLIGDVINNVEISDSSEKVELKVVFWLAVNEVKKYGRADSGCGHLNDTAIRVELYQDPTNPIVTSLVKGNRIKVIRFEGDVERQGGNNDRTTRFQLFEAF